MKKIKFLAFMLSAACALTGLTSCSDDDEGGAGDGTFGSGKKLMEISSKWGYEFYSPVYSGNKLMSFIDDDDEYYRMSISYNGSKAYIMGYAEDNDPSIVNINSFGAAESAEWGYEFDYDADGRMIEWTSDNEHCYITYTDGDIKKVNGSYSGVMSFEYTNEEVTTPIENKGGIMLMEEWGLMWDYEYYYWFGIYGKATKHLPVKVGRTTYDWTLDSDGYPVKCVISGPEEYQNDTFTFTWQ